MKFQTFLVREDEAGTELVLRVFLFGGFTLTWSDAPLPAIPSRHARSLFAYLLTYRHRPHTRDLLAGTFWPDLPDAQARRRLSQALWQINRVLNPLPSPASYLLTKSNTVQFNVAAPYWLDVAEFQSVCTGAGDAPASSELETLRSAVQLYQGDFLAGYYDDWAIVERERLREMVLSALSRLLELCKAQGAYEDALSYAQQLTTENPLREEGHREVMRLLHLLGRDHEALQQYELCRHILAEEIGAEPTEATTALCHAIVTRSGKGETPYLPRKSRPPRSPLLEGTGSVPLVGRERERITLSSYLDKAISGHGNMVLIEGDAGVGKTRLLREFARGAEWRGVQVLWARGQDMAKLPPYGVLRELLRSGLSSLRARQLNQLLDGTWLRETSVLVPELTEWLPGLSARVMLAPEQAHSRLLEALARTVLALGEIAPHVLILEDLQWSDEASLEALTYLVPRLPESHVLVIGSCRSEETWGRTGVWQKLRTLDWTDAYRRLVLSPLTAEECGSLVRRSLALRSRAPTFEARLYLETGGNPLFVLETLRALHDEGVLYRDTSGDWSTPWDQTTTDYAELPLPPGVYQVIARRLAQLTSDEHATLQVASVLGTDFDFELLAQACHRDQESCLAILQELVHRQLLVETSTAYRFSHDRVRQIAYQDMAPEERRQLHRIVAEALENRSPHQVEMLAYHFEQGHVWRRAVRYHVQAGEQARAVQAYASALEHLNKAIALADKADLTIRRRFELLAEHEAVLDVLGKREAQASDLAAMEQLAQNRPLWLAQVYLRQASLWIHTGDSDRAQETARRSLAFYRQLSNEAGQVAALILLGTLFDRHGRPAEAIAPLQEAIALSRALGDQHAEAKAQHALGSALVGTTAYAEAETHLQAALGCYRQLNDSVNEAEALLHLGIAKMEQGHLAEAEACYLQGLSICRTTGYLYGEARLLTNLANVYVFQERTGQALEYYDQAVSIFQQVQSPRGEAQTRLNIASLSLTILGDDQRAQAETEEALAYFRQANNPVGEGQCLSVLGTVFHHRGDLEQARRYLEDGLEKLLAAGERWIAVQVYSKLARVSLDQGDTEAALQQIQAAEEICREIELTDPAVNLLALRGLALLTLGQPEEALSATGKAVAELKPGLRQGYLTLFWHYQVLDALGRMEEARAALGQAHKKLHEALRGLSPEQQQMSLKHVPEHRAILAAWERTHRHATWRLPRTGIPIGRPLRDDEWVEVTWTIEAPEDETISGKANRRRHRLLRLLREAERQGAAPTVDFLAAALRAGRATIKRDLAALRKAGHDVRTRGSRPPSRP